MNQYQKISLLLLRLSTGWLMFYAGITKILDPNWSAAGYLNNAKTFSGLFQWFAQPGILPITNFVNEWALTLIGISLILGMGVRLSSVLGAILMALYYFPVLEFPIVPPHSYLVDDHIIYLFSFIVLGALKTGRIYGFDRRLANHPFLSRFS